LPCSLRKFRRYSRSHVHGDPKQTARATFNLRGLQFDVAGKTGTAESGNGLPHAWFAGYTDNEENTGLPDIAIVVIVENIGEGSEYAVPIFRAMVETYYYGSPQSAIL
jgi:cell division protein FtsI/penicillin-binding protein 2